MFISTHYDHAESNQVQRVTGSHSGEIESCLSLLHHAIENFDSGDRASTILGGQNVSVAVYCESLMAKLTAVVDRHVEAVGGAREDNFYVLKINMLSLEVTRIRFLSDFEAALGGMLDSHSVLSDCESGIKNSAPTTLSS